MFFIEQQVLHLEHMSAPSLVSVLTSSPLCKPLSLWSIGEDCFLVAF